MGSRKIRKVKFQEEITSGGNKKTSNNFKESYINRKDQVVSLKNKRTIVRTRNNESHIIED